MKILLVADGRSRITLSWLQNLLQQDHEVALLSTYPCSKPEGVTFLEVLPVALSSYSGGQVKLADQSEKSNSLKKKLGKFRNIFLKLRYWIGPLTIPFYRRKYRKFIAKIQPDLVHALRIPYEGMLASCTPSSYPLIVSTWGNDLTLHAKGSLLMRIWTRRVLRRADGLMADATRDLDLASKWGFSQENPRIMIPGNGGLDLEFFKELSTQKLAPPAFFKRDHYHIINPRGFRPGSVHQDTFFRSIPLIREKVPNVHFICTAMQGQPEALQWIDQLGIKDCVTLLPYLPQKELWGLYHFSDVYVSLSSHDGTPNTFLEAIACGCFPVVGNIASLAEWIEQDKTGNLVDPLDEKESANAVIQALQNKGKREDARKRNWKILREKADKIANSDRITVFYQKLVSS